MDARLAALACPKVTAEIALPSPEEVMARVESSVLAFMRALVASEVPAWTHQKPRSYKRVQFDLPSQTNRAFADKCTKISFSRSPLSFLFTLTIGMAVHGLALQNLHMTKRDLFYAHASLFGSQRVSDAYLDILAVSLELPRLALPVQASERGLVAGDLTIQQTSKQIRSGLTPGGLSIDATFAHPAAVLSSSAQFVLLVEKDAVFQRLLRDNFEQKWRCIIVTGKGYPDLVTRAFVRRLRLQIGLPVLALCDWDPHGIEILATYKFGSCAMSNSADLAVPGIRWLGVHAADFSLFEIPAAAKLVLGERERARSIALAGRDCMSLEPLWLNELREMQRTNSKAEIEGLSARGVRFLSYEYLPQKLRDGKWHA